MRRSQEWRKGPAVLDVARREVGGLAPRNFALRLAGSEVWEEIKRGLTTLDLVYEFSVMNILYTPRISPIVVFHLLALSLECLLVCFAQGDVATSFSWQFSMVEPELFGLLKPHTQQKDLVLRFQIFKRLQQHLGCVNAVNFNSLGDILLSGSDDRYAILWDWEAGKAKFAFHTGHLNNVFQAKFMPYTNDQTIVTSAADGQVRHAHILEGGVVQTTLLTKHLGRVHRLAIEPGSSHIFYTCGEDGLVQHIDLRSKDARELFTCRRTEDGTREGLIVHLNAVAIDPRNPNLFAVAGSDEFARLYDMRKYRWDGSSDFSQPADYYCPPHLIGSTQVGITGLAFSSKSELLVSYYNECIYLFDRNMGLGHLSDRPQSHVSENTDSLAGMDIDGTIDLPQVYMGHSNCDTVKGVGFFGPQCEYVVSGSDCGRVFIWKKGGKLVRVMEADARVVNCVEPHPHTAVLATSGIEHDIKLWTPNASERADLPPDISEVRTVDTWFGLNCGVRLGLGNEDEDSSDESFDDDDEDEEADSNDGDDSGTDYTFDDDENSDDCDDDDDDDCDDDLIHSECDLDDNSEEPRSKG